MLDILWRHFRKFAAAPECMVEQTAAQADGIIALEVFQHLADLGAGFGAHHKVQPGSIWPGTRSGDDLYRLATG
ncbi:hypothetical protein D3C75_1128770 [compost metagenome]